MDSPFKNMYDTLKEDIWKELGPLDPDWFDALTAQTSVSEGNGCDQEDLHAHQEETFKTPFDKTAADSQLFSTPKVFRCSRVVSPEIVDDEWSAAEQEKETLPWRETQSPCLFRMSKAAVQGPSRDSFDLLHTPQKSPVTYAKNISESLGAHINPDMSWTSSLNTPPVPSTLILTKTNESPCPVSASADKNVVFVRKLFPSLSNASTVGVVSPKNNGIPTVHQGVVSPEAGHNPESHNSPPTPLNHSDGVWRQRLPDAIEDGEIRSTVESVLDGAENVLSIFFTNSSSALRKVKTDRIKRKQIIPAKEHDCSSPDNNTFSKQRTADQEPGRRPSSPPAKTEDVGITQWSPLSLSEIPPLTADASRHKNNPATQVENSILTNQVQSNPDSGQSDRPPVKMTYSGITKKRRTFVYTVDTLKPQTQGNTETHFQKMDSSPGIPDSGQEVNVKQVRKAPHEEVCCSTRKSVMQKHGSLTEENLRPSEQEKVPDSDMSQLCRDFAQDFSQMSDPSKLSKVVEDTPKNGFSPSACLSAMKQAKRQTKHANLNPDFDGVNNRRCVSTTIHSNSIDDGTISDSGFQSAIPDVTPMTASSFVFPSSEHNGQSHQWRGFTTNAFTSTDNGKGKGHLDDIFPKGETDAKLSSAIKKSQALSPVRENELHKESTSTQTTCSARGAVDNINCIPLNGQAPGNLPERTAVSLPPIHASGFKTASNKGIRISSANLERAKRLFEETEGEQTSSDQPTNCAHVTKAEIGSNGSVSNTTSNTKQLTSRGKCLDISCQLTASQKADVTELCTLLEEADSQFEFTQFKTAKLKQHTQDFATTQQKADKDLDPDFLMGIDFDDSFNSDAGKHMAVTVVPDQMSRVSDTETNCETSNIKSKSEDLSLPNAIKIENSSTEDVPSSSKHISERRGNSAGHIETNKLENTDSLMHGAGFKTAGGNILRVSKKCLSKARALFADLEESQKSSDKDISETNSKTQYKRSVDIHTNDLLHHKEDHLKFRGHSNNTGERIQNSFSNMKESVCPGRQAAGIRDQAASIGFKTSKMDPATCQSGFQMASGKGISVSAKAMQEADAFFKDCDAMDTKTAVKQKKDTGALLGSVSHEVNPQKFQNVQRMKENYSEGSISEFENVKAGPPVHRTEDVQNNGEIHNLGSRRTPASINADSPKVLSSLSCTVSKNTGSSVIAELGSGGGFCTASGEKVLVSADAMKKAEFLLNEIHTLQDANKQQDQKGADLNAPRLTNPIPGSLAKNVGFQTANGKGVAISFAALKKAKSLLSEYDDVEDKIGVKTHSKIPFHGPPHRNSGACSKPVALSSEGLHKEKAFFSDIGFSAEGPAVSDTKRTEKQDNAENAEKIHCGFSTAGGAKVHVSQKNLLKAKNLLKEFDYDDDDSALAKAMQETDAFFKDCDIVDGNNGMAVKHKKSTALMTGNSSEKKNLSKLKTDQRVTVNSFGEPESGHTDFDSMAGGPVVDHEMMPCHDVENHKAVFKNTLDSTNASTLHGTLPLMAQPLSSQLCTASKSTGFSAINESSNAGGFCTASGKKVSVSDEAMTKAKSLLSESAAFEHTNKQLKEKEDTFPILNRGFQTASGKGVCISSAALKKAKAVFSECEGLEDKIGVNAAQSKMPVPGPAPKSNGFLAAHSKPVALSSEAVQKAKALFSDITVGAEGPAVSDTRKSDKEREIAGNTEKIHCGFSTAGGAKVNVSERNLLRAKKLLKEFTDGVCHDSNSYSTSPHDAHKSDLSKAKCVRGASNSNLTTAGDTDMPTKESAPQAVQSSTPLQETNHGNENIQNSSVRNPSGVGNLHDSPGEEINQTSSSDGSKGSSVVFFKSLTLSGCTESQYKSLVQETLDCTKAFLEDETLAGQSTSMTLENVELEDDARSRIRSVEEQRRAGKRLVEDPDMTGQPPLKRRLLEEFDRTVDGPRGSALHPEKSSPNGVMKDRRVFKYRVSLHPNITRPHGNEKKHVEHSLQRTTPTTHSLPGDNRAAHFKMAAFVHPFLKNAKMEGHKNNLLKDNMRTSSAFVPPFKKQRTIVQESSSKPQEEEDKHHPFVMPCNSNTFVPHTKNTQSTTDATANKSKEAIQTVAHSDTTNDNVMNNQNLPVGCGGDDSAVEGSHMEDTLSRSQDMFQDLHSVELARDMQDMRIRKKKRQNIRPLPGSLFLTKTSGVTRIPLKAAVNGKPPARFTQKQLYGHGVHRHVYEITSQTAESFRFSLQNFIRQEAFIDSGGVQLADGGWLIPSNDGTAGKEEFYRALCDTPGVDPKLISEEWVYNHYRWIVWKQASMERSFPEAMGSVCLTPEQILLQLKYRYDVEVDHSRRPALRKIMEKDDTAVKTLVLCVCGVVSRGHSPKRQSFSGINTPQGADAKVENPSAVVWLTDGWYAIKAQLDEPLTAMLHKGRLAVGGKMIIHGAQLVGSQDACSPLEAPESLMLKICANSSRPARWDAKLGFHRDPRPFLLPVSCLYSNGGPVGCVDIIILRSYPIQWMERKPDAGVVFRSVRAEEKEARRYNSHKQKAMEILFAKTQAEFEKEEKGNDKPQRRRRTISHQSIASLQDGEELYQAVGDDASYLEAHLSNQQLETLHAYRRSLMEKKHAELQERYRRALENADGSDGGCPKRDVTPVWRLCFADSMDPHCTAYQLNLWRPSSDLQSVLKEGCRYKVYNLTASEGKKLGGATGTVQLTGTKKTQFQEQQASLGFFQPRVSTQFVDLQNPQFQPLCGEVDLTGYIISVIDGQASSPAFYLADGKLSFVKVRCFSSLAQSGLEDLVKPRVLLALSNLQLRGQSTSPTPVVYAGDLTVFSTNPKEPHLRESLSQLRNLVQGQENFFLAAEERLSHLVSSDGLSSICSPALQARTTVSTADKRCDTKTSVTVQQPARSLGSFTPVSRNLPSANCSAEKDPSSLKRRRALDYLSRIPSPPPVLHLRSLASPCINKTFNPPRRSGTPSTLKTVQAPAPPVGSPVEDGWVNDEELAMIDTQALLVGDLL